MPIAHGVEIREIPEGYAQPLIKNIRKRLSPAENSKFVAIPYNYTIKTNERQMAMFNAVEKGLGNEELRRLKHTVGSDVTWSFILAKGNGDCFYRDFINDVTNLIENARAKYPACKVVCIGHSQGSQLFYSFFFDYAKPIDCFIGLGSPIAMNSGAYTDWGRVPLNLRYWINFWHWMDFVSSPLQGKHLSEVIGKFVVDYEIPSAWWKVLYKLPRPLCKMMAVVGLKAHVSYWSSDFVADKIAKKIKELMA